MRRPRLLFVSWHFYLDHSNGASISARELLLGLSQRGLDVKTFCGPIVDDPGVSGVFDVSDVRGILKRCGVPFVENEFGASQETNACLRRRLIVN